MLFGKFCCFSPLKHLFIIIFFFIFCIKCVLCKRSFCVSNSNNHRLFFFFSFFTASGLCEGRTSFEPLTFHTLFQQEWPLLDQVVFNLQPPNFLEKNFSFSTKLCFPITVAEPHTKVGGPRPPQILKN